MSILPDYGIHLLDQGLGQVSQHFHALQIDHLTILEPGAGFTTMINLEHKGRSYAVSFDLPDPLWEELSGALPDDVHEEIGAELALIEAVPYTIEFSRPVRVQITARVGTPQAGAHDVFVPLVIERIEAAEP